MDREIVISVLLLVTLTWLLYKLIVMLEPHDTPASGKPSDDSSADASGAGIGQHLQKTIHQRLRE